MEQTDFSSATIDVMRRGEDTLYRLGRGQGGRVLLVVPDLETAKSRKRLEHELALRSDLDASWASRPIALTRYGDRLALELQDPGGEPLDRLIGQPLDTARFLQIASNRKTPEFFSLAGSRSRPNMALYDMS